MIEELRIQGIGVISEARIELGPGLTVLTGETGAGKTMVLNGLDLLRGARADSGVLRDQDSPAEVDAVVALGIDGYRGLLAELETLDIPVLDDALVTRRTVAPGGRSRAYLAGRATPVGSLASVWSQMVAVHGQQDQVRLRDSSWQRGIVDQFGGPDLLAARTTYEHTWREWQTVQEELRELLAQSQERERTAALLRLGIAEIDEVSPESGEEETLASEAAVLTHAGSLLEAAQAARHALIGGDDDIDSTAAISRLAQAKDSVDSVVDVDPRLTDIASRLDGLIAEATDLEADLGSYLRGLDADPARQAWVEERRSQLAALRKSYGATIDDVIAWREEASSQLAGADESVERIEALTNRQVVLAQTASANAAALSQARRRSADALVDAVAGELAELAMPDARIEVRLESSDLPAELRAHGGDDLQMLLVPHAGAPARPIGKGASGGELSRLALAFEVALAGTSPVPTMVFDEVDAGIGGAVAVEVGRRLARLARHVQVVVVTHLPQVAAFADRHIVVTKSKDGSVTTANIRCVEGDERVGELVRMLSGLEGSATGAAHAQELLDVASDEKSSGSPDAARPSVG